MNVLSLALLTGWSWLAVSDSFGVDATAGPPGNSFPLAAEAADVATCSAPKVTVAPGTFMMGAEPGPDFLKSSRPVIFLNAKNEEVRIDQYQGPNWDERPVHVVTISSAFDLSVRHVSLRAFLRYKPQHAEEYASRSLRMDPSAPVTLVTWDEALGYCLWLGATEGSVCRLPTEAEWEYAAVQAAALGLERVGQGVREWCHDWWARYGEAAVTDPLGPEDGVVRVIRGRVDTLGHFRTTDRSGGMPDERLTDVSFRVARVRSTAGMHRPLPRPDRVFQNVVQSPKSWQRPANPDTPVFAGGHIYIKKSEISAGELPYWGRHHVPSISWCDNGDLLATVMTCPNDSSEQMAILLTRLRDGAETWDPPARFFILPDRDVDASILHRDDDGVLYHFNAMGRDELAQVAARRTSRDNGATWSRPETVRFHRSTNSPDAPFQAAPTLLHLDLISLDDGALLLARDVDLNFRPLGTTLFKSLDKGMSWHEMTRLGWQAENFGQKGKQAGWIAGWHAAVAVLRDGGFLAIGRTCDIDGRAPISRSTDHGKTWTYLPSGFSPISSSQRPIIKRLAEGHLMVVYYTDSSEIARNNGQPVGIEIRDVEGMVRRVYGTYTALSFDDGMTWSHQKLLPASDEEPYKSDRNGYYSSVQTPDRMIHLISTHRYYRFNLAWLMEPMPADR